jgi:hypothetical protein
VLPGKSLDSAFRRHSGMRQAQRDSISREKLFFDFRMEVYDLPQRFELEGAAGSSPASPEMFLAGMPCVGSSAHWKSHDVIPFPKRDPDVASLGRR